MLFALGGAAQPSGAPAPVWWALYLACYVTGGWAPRDITATLPLPIGVAGHEMSTVVVGLNGFVCSAPRGDGATP